VGKYVVGIENRVHVPRVRGTQTYLHPTAEYLSAALAQMRAVPSVRREKPSESLNAR
jgi:hypothetical protein